MTPVWLTKSESKDSQKKMFASFGTSINHVDMEGEGVSQMSILLHTKPYYIKWSTKGKGGSKKVQKLSTWFMNGPILDMNMSCGDLGKFRDYGFWQN